jgi:OOP family OmpA-OmpF porin
VKTLNAMRSSALLAGVLLCSAAYAQPYLGGGIGKDNASVPTLSTTISGVPVTGTGTNNSKTSYKLFGGYQFTPNWGAEIAYVQLGSSHGVNATIAGVPATGSYKLYSLNFAGTGTLPLEGGFSLLGKLGVSANRSSAGNICAAGVCAAMGSSSKTNLLWGIGAQYAFTKQWALRLEYEDFGKMSNNDVWGTGNSGALKATDWTLSLKYSF